VTVNTRRIDAVPGGTVVCTALNVSGRAITITAQIIDRDGVNVTDLVATERAEGNRTDFAPPR
jgi:hypothetical protein